MGLGLGLGLGIGFGLGFKPPHEPVVLEQLGEQQPLLQRDDPLGRRWRGRRWRGTWRG